ncbi:MAG TPA: sulfotransferase, partial [Phycisphaerales bacterium]|nr:sulfotransferase [Phycisphaerales bacterium]
ERDIGAALRSTPSPPPAWHATLAQVRRGQGRLEEAAAIIESARRTHPAAQVLASTLAEILSTLRRYDEAHALLADLIARGADRPGLLSQFGRVCRHLGRPADALAPLRAASIRANLAPAALQPVLFELGHVLDALGDFDAAFDAFARANALEQRTFDIERHGALVGRVVATWTREALASLPRPAGSGGGEGIVLIVGMRRSGTTLAEQILAAHPDVAAGGELPWLRDLAAPLDPGAAAPFGLVVEQSLVTAGSVGAVRRGYEHLAAPLRAGAPAFTDKMPANFKLLGVAQLALPRARVVWCRRDPLDTCLSCYMQPFNDNSYSADLRTLARYWHDCDRLITHWRSVLDLPIHELVYERLVAEPEREVRALLGFLGLSFEESCLRFHESGRNARTASTDQVARPLYASSAGRAQRYRRRLGPLIDELARLGHTQEAC